jgi:hypothetical protein
MTMHRYSIGDAIVFDLSPRWWRNPIRWVRWRYNKWRTRHVRTVVTAVDHETGTITLETRRE